MAAVTNDDWAWRLLLAAAACRRAGELLPAPGAWRVTDRDGIDVVGTMDAANAAERLPGEGKPAAMPVGELLEIVPADDGRAVLVRRVDGTFGVGPAMPPEVKDFVELYLPMLGGADGRPFVLAHLGQSVDASIASVEGANDVVTGPEDFAHMHRLRALADAVLVGAGTIATDDPRLTVRLVDGPDPVRVVLDPNARLGEAFGVFADGLAPTVRVRSTRTPSPRGSGTAAKSSKPDGVDAADSRDEHAEHAEHDQHDGAPGAGRPFGVDVLDVPSGEDGLSLGALGAALLERGLRVVFIEGGGVTVTRWMEAGLLDRLHLVAAPLLLGDARPSLRLPGASDAAAASRPPCRLYQLGEDVLWDFDLRGVRTHPDAARRSTPFQRLV